MRPFVRHVSRLRLHGCASDTCHGCAFTVAASDTCHGCAFTVAPSDTCHFTVAPSTRITLAPSKQTPGSKSTNFCQ
eukprot:2656026-Rhodomonas_salina.1